MQAPSCSASLCSNACPYGCQPDELPNCTHTLLIFSLLNARVIPSAIISSDYTHSKMISPCSLAFSYHIKTNLNTLTLCLFIMLIDYCHKAKFARTQFLQCSRTSSLEQISYCVTWDSGVKLRPSKDGTGLQGLCCDLIMEHCMSSIVSVQDQRTAVHCKACPEVTIGVRSPDSAVPIHGVHSPLYSIQAQALLNDNYSMHARRITTATHQ
jgi:hypothetical protein